MPLGTLYAPGRTSTIACWPADHGPANCGTAASIDCSAKGDKGSIDDPHECDPNQTDIHGLAVAFAGCGHRAFHPGANSERGQPGDHANDREIVIMISGDVYEIDSYRRNDVALMGDRLDAWQTFLGPNFPPHPPTAGPVLPEHRIGVAKHAAAV
jgi:hypothetical protein